MLAVTIDVPLPPLEPPVTVTETVLFDTLSEERVIVVEPVDAPVMVTV